MPNTDDLEPSPIRKVSASDAVKSPKATKGKAEVKVPQTRSLGGNSVRLPAQSAGENCLAVHAVVSLTPEIYNVIAGNFES